MPEGHGFRVFLHAGFHKTGTTSAQRCLAANRAALAPRFHLELPIDNPALREVTETARAYAERRDALNLALFEGLTAAWLAERPRAPGQDILISSEDFAGHMPGMRGLCDYGAAVPLARAFVAAVAAAFGPQAQPVLIWSTRAPGPWLASLHAQQARHAHLTQDAATFAAALAGAAALDVLVDRIAAEVAPVPVVRFDLETAQADPLGPAGALLGCCGMTPAQRAGLRAVPRANPSVPADTVAAFVALNRLGLPRDELRARKAALLRAANLPDGAPEIPVSEAGETR